MNEVQWLTCVNPEKMLTYLKYRNAGERKLRLLSVAYCRRIWHLLTDPNSRWAVEVAERFADGLATQQELTNAGENAEEAGRQPGRRLTPDNPGSAAFAVSTWPKPWVSQVALITANCLARANEDPSLTRQMVLETECALQCDLIHDVFGNPFGKVTIDDSRLSANDGTVQKLAEAIYADKRFEEMPILGDALEEVGCNEQAMLDHCRNRRSHVRGCWVLDLLLTKD